MEGITTDDLSRHMVGYDLQQEEKGQPVVQGAPVLAGRGLTSRPYF